MSIFPRIALCIAFAVTGSVLCWMLKLKSPNLAIDHPNDRSLHTTPVPRTGGLGLMAGILIAWAMVGQAWLLPLSVCIVFLILLSYFDDMHQLSPGWRFLGHFVAAGVFLRYATPLAPGVGMAILMTLAIVWMTNLYNFMDGSDGLAGGMAFFGFIFYALAAWLATDWALMIVALIVSASAAAFLLFNFHPAKIFMGDAGSIPLGFLAATLGLLGWQRGDWQLYLPILVFSPFIVDATVTLLRRLVQKEKVWQAHRSHYYQRLVQMGYGHKKTALAEYVLMAAVGLSAIWLMKSPLIGQIAGLLVWAGIYACLMLWVDRRWQHSLATS
jgi:UDP-N-acetylmuramyl pentapeptide phosphotransferase/UDP-N-acetylglucosamine-1-phosphate transferase